MNGNTQGLFALKTFALKIRYYVKAVVIHLMVQTPDLSMVVQLVMLNVKYSQSSSGYIILPLRTLLMAPSTFSVSLVWVMYQR